MSVSAVPRPSWAALIPFGVFVFFYAGLSIWANDFYKIPMPVAFAVASASAFFLDRKRSVDEKVDVFISGMGDRNIMLMCLIFILAGAFASVTKTMGAVDAAVIITQTFIPSKFLLAGIFVISSLISLAIGTSCGTIAALTPIALGLTAPMGIQPELMLGAVVGGSMFGDNMSMISDTTIAATRTQNVAMREKFYANIKLVLPASAAVICIYLFSGNTAYAEAAAHAVGWKDFLLVVPYLIVMILALCGINVIILLFFGVLFSCTLGVGMGAFDVWDALGACGKGTLGMSETLIVAILAGGLLNLIRWNGGIEFLLKMVRQAIRTSKGCEIGVFLLVSLVNLFTANNTVAIVMAGPIAKELSDRYKCAPRRIASILDTASCFVQGVIPYGAQLLIAGGIAKASGITISTAALLGSQYYQWLVLGSLCTTFLLRRKKA